MKTKKLRAWDKKKKAIIAPISLQEMLKYLIFQSNPNADAYMALKDHFEDIIWNDFIGLKDRNGNEVYEDDLVETEFGVGRVVMDEKGRWGAIFKDGDFYDFAYGIDFINVVGIFWEAPELLE